MKLKDREELHNTLKNRYKMKDMYTQIVFRGNGTWDWGGYGWVPMTNADYREGSITYIRGTDNIWDDINNYKEVNGMSTDEAVDMVIRDAEATLQELLDNQKTKVRDYHEIGKQITTS